MTESSKKTDNMSFEEALSELEEIVKSLETGKASLENSITSYERGVALKKHCEKKLKEAQTKIEKIAINENGDISSSVIENES